MTLEVPAEITEDGVRDLLAHLYDNTYLREHPLLPVLVRRHMPDPLARTQHLRNLVIEAIHSLRPPAPVVARSREWRPYGILVYRYLDGMTDEQILDDLSLSERQFFRDLKAGIALLATALQARVAPEGGEESLADPLDTALEDVGLQFERLDLNDLGAEVLPLVRGLASVHGKEVAFAPASGHAIAVADAALSRQALISALSSSLRRAAGDVGLEVISGVQTQAVFLRYVDAAGSDDDAGDGALDLAQRLLERQGGSLQQHLGPSGERLVGLHWRRFEEPSVLIVDDNPGMLRLFARYLSGHGYRVVSTSDGAEAVSLARENGVRLVIVDVMMREMDGWAVLQQLKAEPQTQEVPVLICSVVNEPELAVTLGATGLLKKPVSREQLLDAVAAIIGI
ncbi:MAG: response regulator [Anaerolineae bacterium]